MEYLVLPLPNGGKVAIPLDGGWLIWSSKTGETTFLGAIIDSSEAIEVDASFEEVMTWFDHYVEPGNTATKGVQKDPAKPRRRGAMRIVETEVK